MSDESSTDNEEIKNQIEKIKDIPRFIENTVKIEKFDDKIVFHRLKCLKTSIVNFLFTLGLYQSFNQFYEEHIRMKKPTISNIRIIFKEVYERIGLGSNLRFLERDLKHLESYKPKITEENELIEIKKLIQNDLITNNKEQKTERDAPFSDEKRNFFAHSGFNRNYILVKKNEDGELELYHEDCYLDRIRKWLLNPED